MTDKLAELREKVNTSAEWDYIDHPPHYTKGIETTDYIMSWGMDFLEGNIIKYVTRYRHKNGVEDLRKGMWYLERLIRRAEKE